MSKKNLVLVESPAKAKTIGRILGKSYKVVSSMGHVIDLPKTKLGVDIEHDFTPQYIVISTRRKILSELKKEAKIEGTIYIATDPDREGEAIGWHIKERIYKDNPVQRVIFHEITPTAIKEAFKHPRDFDVNMLEAQAGRRILDRIVGYFLSPLLWKKIGGGLSAGRVQSVALRLIVERQRQIDSFTPKEYWEIEVKLKKIDSEELFTVKLIRIDGKDPQLDNDSQTNILVADLQGKKFIVAEIKESSKNRFPDPPFITSTLQQEAYNKLRFTASKTMFLAQQLYEGVDVGEEGTVGLITYMRTDSTQVSQEALKEARAVIGQKFGAEYLPETPHVYKNKKHAQEAHEAVRPTLISREPESLINFLSSDQYKLYELIYRRFLASQMNPARYLNTTAFIRVDRYDFSASSSKQVFAGFQAVYPLTPEQQEQKEKNILPALSEAEELIPVEFLPSQHFTKPPPRYTDSSIVKALEEAGIGRPSTYAPIINTLVYRDYIRREKGAFSPTELGIKVCDMLVEYFPKIMDVNFTALLEDELDEIEEGKFTRQKVLADFYAPFKESLDFAQENIKKEILITDEVCKECGKPMIIKWGRKGKFLSCSAFPECKHARSITTGIKCPKEGCTGELIERRSRRGSFYGCSAYPKCTYIANSLPSEGTKNEDQAGEAVS